MRYQKDLTVVTALKSLYKRDCMSQGLHLAQKSFAAAAHKCWWYGKDQNVSITCCCYHIIQCKLER